MVKEKKQKAVPGAGEPKDKKWPDCCKDCTHDWQSKELTPDSNELLNIFLIVMGGLSILYGLFYYFPDLFPWLAGLSGDPGFQAIMGILGGTNMIIGVFAFIAGIGLFQEQEWAWGMALMVLVFIISNTLLTVISSISGGTFNWGSWSMWMQLISLIFAVLGIPWLLATKARYY